MKYSIELWEYENKIFLEEMYKILINDLKNNIYENGTYSKFVKFIYSHYYNHNIYNIFT
jgi:hypothetical protein